LTTAFNAGIGKENVAHSNRDGKFRGKKTDPNGQRVKERA